MRHLLRISLLVLGLNAAPGALPAAAEPPEWLVGDWVLNSDKTHELQPKESGGGLDGSMGRPSISVGGIPIPLPGGPESQGSGGTRDPRVLRCDAMTVTASDENLHFSYRGAGEELMRPGNDQGRKTQWSRRKLTQTYTTNTRSVRKTYELDADGHLVVKVRINPKGSKAATHVRVFERPAA